MAHDVEMASATRLSVVINGVRSQVRSATLEAVLAELGYGDRKVATAVNGEFVAARVRAQTALHPGDEIEIVAPQQGG